MSDGTLTYWSKMLCYIIKTFVKWKEIKNITSVNNIIMNLRFGTLHVDLMRFYIEFYNFSTNMEISFIIVILDPN